MERLWMTLDQIKAEYASSEYNPEMLLQHLLHHVEASPASVPEGKALWDSVYKTLRNYRMTMMVNSDGDGYPLIDAMSPEQGTVESGIEECTYLADAIYNDLLAAAPTPPVSEGVDPVMTKEELIAAAESIGMRFPGASIPPVSEDRKDAERFREGWTHACNALCMEIALWIERCPHCGMPAPKAPATQEDKP